MRVIFMGTPDFAVPILRAAMPGNEIVAVYSQPPRPIWARAPDDPVACSKIC